MITIDQLQARYDRLAEQRQRNLKQLEECQEREHGYKYVLGELELMITEEREKQRAADAAAAADLAAAAASEGA